MRNLLLGIDSGTQSTKVVAVDANTGNVLGTGAQAYDLIPNLPPGAKEQHPHTWRDATAKAIRQALRGALAANPWLHYAGAAAGAFFVVAVGRWQQRRAAAAAH